MKETSVFPPTDNLKILLGVAFVMVTFFAQAALSAPMGMSPADENIMNSSRTGNSSQAMNDLVTPMGPGKYPSGSMGHNGGRAGDHAAENQAAGRYNTGSPGEVENKESLPMKEAMDTGGSTVDSSNWGSPIPYAFNMDHKPQDSTTSDTFAGYYFDNNGTLANKTSTAYTGSGNYYGGGGCLCGGAGSGGGGGDSGGSEQSKPFGLKGHAMNMAGMATGTAVSAAQGAQMGNDVKSGTNNAKGNGMSDQASRASSAGESALENAQYVFDNISDSLINVANENAGSPTGAKAPFKTYSMAVYMVQQMWKQCYLPLAILFLLPGAVITNTKAMVGFGILGTKDEDTVSPFVGIFRATIAIFLIPATQLIVSYMIDVGNALQDCATKHVSLPLILLWAEEQVQIWSTDQQGKLIKDMPDVPMAPYLGKFAGMPVKMAQMEQIDGLNAALAELSNECFHVLSMGLTIASGFQLVMICYLFLLGPLAAAFFAWPSGVGRDLFRKAFSSWVDGVVILSLWRFWWNVVLLVMTVRLQSEGVNPFSPFEVYYLAALLSILLFVPFNPFEFKPGELVTHVLGKAEAVAAKVAQGGKGGGSKGGGKAGGGGGGGGGGCGGGEC